MVLSLKHYHLLDKLQKVDVNQEYLATIVLEQEIEIPNN